MTATARLGRGRDGVRLMSAFAVFLIVALVAAIPVAGAGTRSSGPSLTLSQSTGLVDRQSIVVHGQGFHVSILVLAECLQPSDAFSGSCKALAVPDATNAFSIAVQPEVVVRQPMANPWLDCGRRGCFIVAFTPDGSILASRPISFAASSPRPALPQITASPNSNLADGATVAVHVSGLRANAAVHLNECSPGFLGASGAVCSTAIAGRADGHGALSMSIRTTDHFVFQPQGTVLCGGKVDRYPVLPCGVFVTDDADSRSFGGAELSFAVHPLPTLHVVPLSIDAANRGAVVQVPIALDRKSSSTVTVHYVVKGYDAAAGVNFVAAQGTLKISPWATGDVILVRILKDPALTKAKTVLVVLSAPVNAALGGYNGVGSIVIQPG